MLTYICGFILCTHNYIHPHRIYIYIHRIYIYIYITPEKYIDYANIVQKTSITHYMCADIFLFPPPKQIFPCLELCQGTQSPLSSGPREGVDDPGTAKQGSWVLWIVDFSRCCSCSGIPALAGFTFWDLVVYGSISEMLSLTLPHCLCSYSSLEQLLPVGIWGYQVLFLGLMLN